MVLLLRGIDMEGSSFFFRPASGEDRNVQIYTIDFENLYSKQTWHQDYGRDVNSLCLNISSGINGYCSVEAQQRIKQACTAIQMPALTFLGSGNYHYLTYFLIRKIQQPFSLVLFDFHSDMQAGFGESLLSCGNWLSFALRDCPNLKQVFICGISEQYIPSVTLVAPQQPYCFTEKVIHSTDWLADLKGLIRYPIYVSIDKDVFDTEFARTNWDQGSMKRETIKSFFDLILPSKVLLGGDICGEYPMDYTDFSHMEIQSCNNETNSYLIGRFLEQQIHKKRKVC